MKVFVEKIIHVPNVSSGSSWDLLIKSSFILSPAEALEQALPLPSLHT